MNRYDDDDTSVSAQEWLAREWGMYQSVEAGARPLRAIWEASRPAVVLGRSNRPAEWIDADACRRDGIEILARRSGGGAVVIGPGCLNYAVCLSLEATPHLADVAASFRFVHRHLVTAFDVPGLAMIGMTDLAWDGRKVSGNAQRRGRRALLHHGTVLYDFDPELAERYLRRPPRQPAYRAQRAHRAFMGNLPLPRESVRGRLAQALDAIVHSSAGWRPDHGHRDAWSN